MIPAPTIEALTRWADIDRDTTKQGLVRSILGVCDDMGVEAVMEGAETQAEISTLVDLGAQLVQGYGIGRPNRSFLKAMPEFIQ